MVLASWDEEGRRTRVAGWRGVVVVLGTFCARERNIVGEFRSSGIGWEGGDGGDEDFELG